jgi:molybdopterin molybdotransferase
VVKAFDRQDSSMMKLLAHANCLIIRPPHDRSHITGEDVEILEFEEGF